MLEAGLLAFRLHVTGLATDHAAGPGGVGQQADLALDARGILLRGEDLELVSREIGTTAADLSRWRDSFLEAGAASLKTRPEDGRDRELKAMREKIGAMTMANELLEAKIERLEAGTPFRLRRSKR